MEEHSNIQAVLSTSYCGNSAVKAISWNYFPYASSSKLSGCTLAILTAVWGSLCLCKQLSRNLISSNTYLVSSQRSPAEQFFGVGTLCRINPCSPHWLTASFCTGQNRVLQLCIQRTFSSIPTILELRIIPLTGDSETPTKVFLHTTHN